MKIYVERGYKYIHHEKESPTILFTLKKGILKRKGRNL